ncbi:MAG: hypothetical protein VX951_13115, partial [Planctomycetota bacterium]|nr:hypothetical protein [Planctomycetota bacterium]
MPMNPSSPRFSVLASLLFVLTPSIVAQVKPALTHDDYDRWPSLRSTAYSVDGKWVAYTVNPSWGDGMLYVQEVDGERRFTHARGSRPSFSANGRYVVFSESKSAVKERKTELAKLRGEKSAELEAEAKKKAAEETKAAEERRREMMARFSRGQRSTRSRGRSRGRSGSSGTGALYILDLQTGKKEKIEKTKGHRLAKEGEYLVYHLPKPEEKKPAEKKPADK